jgi:hypothetical protein
MRVERVSWRPKFRVAAGTVITDHTTNDPVFLARPHMCVKPRKSNVSGLPSPLRLRLSLLS